MRTPPIVFCRVDASGADTRAVKGTNITHAKFSAPQVVQVDVDLGRSVDRNVDIFVADDVLRNHGPENRRAAIATVDVDSYRAGGGRVERVCQISRDEVADDLVPRHIICRKAESGAHMGVQGDASQSV